MNQTSCHGLLCITIFFPFRVMLLHGPIQSASSARPAMARVCKVGKSRQDVKGKSVLPMKYSGLMLKLQKQRLERVS